MAVCPPSTRHTTCARSAQDGESRGDRDDVVTACLQRLRAVDEVTNCVAAWNDEDALARADVLDRPGTRRSGRSAARPADHREGLDRRRRSAVYRRVRGVSRSEARGRRHGRGADARGRCDRARQDDGAGGHRALRAGPQPTRSDPFARVLEQRRGSRGRRRRLSPGARKRLGWEHPAPGRVVRRAGPQAVGRTRADDRSLPARRRARRRAHGDRTDRRARSAHSPTFSRSSRDPTTATPGAHPSPSVRSTTSRWRRSASAGRSATGAGPPRLRPAMRCRLPSRGSRPWARRSSVRFRSISTKHSTSPSGTGPVATASSPGVTPSSISSTGTATASACCGRPMASTRS